MKTIAAIIALTSVAAAQMDYLRVMALRSASPIHFAPLEAREQRLFLGGKTESYCPEQVEQASGCPAGNTTTVVEDNGFLSMGTYVPGGQHVYIDNCTVEVSYTQAHSGFVPEHAILDGWSVKQNYTAGGALGLLNWTNGLLACPENDQWQIFARVEGLFFTADCLGFSAVFTNSTAPTAWQYT